jgi:hypothetical protein
MTVTTLPIRTNVLLHFEAEHCHHAKDGLCFWIVPLVVELSDGSLACLDCCDEREQ